MDTAQVGAALLLETPAELSNHQTTSTDGRGSSSLAAPMTTVANGNGCMVIIGICHHVHQRQLMGMSGVLLCHIITVNSVNLVLE